MDNPPDYRFPNLANIVIGLLESKVENLIGKSAVGELKKPYVNKELKDKLFQSIRAAEKRFISTYPTMYISEALRQLSIADLPSIQSAIWSLYLQPTDLVAKEEIQKQLINILPENYPAGEVLNAVEDYLIYIWEELTVIPEIKEKLDGLMQVRTERHMQESVSILREINKKLPEQDVEKKQDLTLAAIKQDISVLVNLFSSDFIGREFVFNAIDHFIAGQDRGYFLIEGDPGAGKSAIIAQFIKRNNSIAHFNNRAVGVTSPEEFLQSISLQLASRFSLPYHVGEIQNRMKRDARFLLQLLNEANTSLNGNEKILITIDAIDEAESLDNNSANNLFLPTQLPENVYFILSSRRGGVKLVTHTPFSSFDLYNHPENNEADVREYIELRIRNSQSLRNFIVQKGFNQNSFVDLLTKKSEYNFMYLKSILTDMHNQQYADINLNGLPQGLTQYYEDHWFRMGMEEINVKTERLVKIIYVLAAVIFPVSRREIASIIAEEEITVQYVLDNWRQYLHIEEDNREKYYSIYHQSFRDFLYRKDIVDSAKVSLPYIHALIAKKFKENLGL